MHGKVGLGKAWDIPPVELHPENILRAETKKNNSTSVQRLSN